MFDTTMALDELDAAGALTLAARLRATADHAETRLLQVAAHYADLHTRTPTGELGDGQILPGMERHLVYGGDGCPEVAEFAPVDLGAALGISSGAASALLGEALALRHRLPRLWARVLAGQVQAWRARKIAHTTLGLSQAAAAEVDVRVAGIAQSVTPHRLARIVHAARMHADPERAQAEADAAARERGVWTTQTDQHGTKTLVAKAATGDIIRLDAMIDLIADRLAALGDTTTKDHRRATAIGWLADPAATLTLCTTTHTPNPEGPEGPEDPDRFETSEDHEGPADREDPAEHAPGKCGEGEDGRVAADGEDGRVGQSCEDRGPGDSRPRNDGGTADKTRHESRQSGGTTDGGTATADHDPDHIRRTDRSTSRTIGQDTDRSTRQNTDGDTGRGTGRNADAGENTAPASGFEDAGESLAAKIAWIRQTSRAKPGARPGTGAWRSGPLGAHTLYVHLTDHTLTRIAATGNVDGNGNAGNGSGNSAGTDTGSDGVIRVENLGPLLASQLGELLGHDQIIVKPVIDLNHQISADAYEIPHRIREHVRLRQLTCAFPWCNRDATTSIDLDHTVPYDDTGPPGQTSTQNLAPCCRLHHRVKTHGRWSYTRLPDGAFEWTSPHGHRYRVDHTGTHHLTTPPEPTAPAAPPDGSPLDNQAPPETTRPNPSADPGHQKPAA